MAYECSFYGLNLMVPPIEKQKLDFQSGCKFELLQQGHMEMRATTNCAVAISMHDHVLNTAVFNYGS